MPPTNIVNLWSNGHGTVFDKDGQAIDSADLQKGWLTVYCEYLESKGIDPSTTIFNAQMLEDTFGKKAFQPFKTDDGEWNYQIIE